MICFFVFVGVSTFNILLLMFGLLYSMPGWFHEVLLEWFSEVCVSVFWGCL